jgi:hypothetical protein
MITILALKTPCLFSVFVSSTQGLTTDKGCLRHRATRACGNDHDRTAYDILFYQLMLSHDDAVKNGVDALVAQTRTRSRPEVVRSTSHDLLFPTWSQDRDVGGLFGARRYQLGRLLRMAMDMALDLAKPTDRDHFEFKPLRTSGDLCWW